MSLPVVPDLPLGAALACLLLLLLLASRVRVLSQLLQLALLAGLLVLVATMLNERIAFDPALERLADLVRPGGQVVTGDEVRVPISSDGHFWVLARINGVETRLLIDSGATVTALSAATARITGLHVRTPFAPVLLHTANGTVRARTTRIGALRFGPVVARNLSAVVSPAFGDMDVLGMNFLSRLKSWRVEDNVLVMVPRHPARPDPSDAAGSGPAGWLAKARGFLRGDAAPGPA